MTSYNMLESVTTIKQQMWTSINTSINWSNYYLNKQNELFNITSLQEKSKQQVMIQELVKSINLTQHKAINQSKVTSNL